MRQLNVFFSAPATNDEKIRHQYQAIVEGLRYLGFKITYDWLNDQEDYDTQSTTNKAIRAIEVSDLLVAENTVSSTGVGSQIALARARKIPIIILKQRDSKNINNFFDPASFGPAVKTRVYTTDDLVSVLSEAARSVTKERLVKFNFVSTAEINQRIEIEAKKLKLSKSEYLRDVLSKYFSL